MKHEPKLVQLSDELLKKIKNPTFQRPLNVRRVPKILKSGAEGNLIPPIVIADTQYGYYVVDGQHRLEARRKGDFTLYANVYKMTQEEALKAFIVVNTTGTRVSLAHRLKVDSDKNAKTIREIATKFESPVMKVCAVMGGMIVDNRSNLLLHKFEDGQFHLAEKIMLIWTSDKRWAKPELSYSDNATLRIVSSIAFKAKNYAKSLDAMKGVDFTEDSEFTKYVRGGYQGQNKAKNYMRDYLLEKIG